MDTRPEGPAGAGTLRRITPLRALVAAVPFGVGYVYVGRIDAAVALIGGQVTLAALMAWTGLLFSPAGVYAFALVCVTAHVGAAGHAVILAARQPLVARKPYTNPGGYVGWWIATCAVTAVLSAFRADYLGLGSFIARSAAMSPTIESGDLLVADLWRYRDEPPLPGDVVLFNAPGRPGPPYVQRVIGVPGDAIAVRGGVVYRNRAPVDEPYLHAPWPGAQYGRDVAPVVLGPDEYYLLGDFRDNSRDSRLWGTISRRSILGRVEHVWLSVGADGVHWSRFPRRLAR